MTSLTHPSRLLLREPGDFDVDRLLVVMPPADAGVGQLQTVLPDTDLSVFTTICESASLARSVLPADKVFYGHDPKIAGESFDGIILFLQKSRALTEGLLDCLLPLLNEQGRLFLVGENSAGIKSWRKRLQAYGKVENIASACHSGLLMLEADTSERKAGGLKSSQFSLSVAGTELKVSSLPGVFSHGRLDKGTEILLETLAHETITGNVLDFGCGAGIIGTWLGLRQDGVKPVLVDTDALAVQSSRCTLEANKVAGEVVASHGLQAVDGRYNWIISNPPFHEGVKTRYDVTESFLTDCASLLRPGGQLRVVANSFLNYAPLIKEAFGSCQQLAQRHGFTIYAATKN